jgi:hypothetical protein
MVRCLLRAVKSRVGGRLSGQDAVLKNDSAGISGCGQGFETLTSDRIKYDACAHTAGNLADTFGRIFFIGHDDLVGPDCEQFDFFLAVRVVAMLMAPWALAISMAAIPTLLR